MAVALGIWGLSAPQSIPLCFNPDDKIVCPAAESLYRPDAGAIHVGGERIDTMDEPSLMRIRGDIGSPPEDEEPPEEGGGKPPHSITKRRRCQSRRRR